MYSIAWARGAQGTTTILTKFYTKILYSINLSLERFFIYSFPTLSTIVLFLKAKQFPAFLLMLMV